jgi:hypothetical protein
MGLDIYAYSNVKLDKETSKKLEDCDDQECDSIIGKNRVAYINPDFPKHTKDLESTGWTLRSAFTSTGEHKPEISMSCGGYGVLRAMICEAVLGIKPKALWEIIYADQENYNHDENPLTYLINFSDCEGTIGPSVSKKIYKSLIENEEKISSFITDSWYKERFIELVEVFRVGSLDGIVTFS